MHAVVLWGKYTPGATGCVTCGGLIFHKFLLGALCRQAYARLVYLALCLTFRGDVSCQRLIVLV
jgi:hypothetical protein